MKEDINNLVDQVLEYNDSNAFNKLEIIAKPMLKRVSLRFSKYHSKFEYDDFYSIAKIALYKSCLKYDKKHSSTFLYFAKLFILRDLWKEVSYWNFEKRNIFNQREENIEEYNDILFQEGNLENKVIMNECLQQIWSIIERKFNNKHQMILKLYIFKNLTITEIAGLLDIKYKSVYSVVMRGQKKIIKWMHEEIL